MFNLTTKPFSVALENLRNKAMQASDQRLYEQDLEDLLQLVDVYKSFPRRSLISILEERGAGNFELHELQDIYLISLAVHTHRPGWFLQKRQIRFKRKSNGVNPHPKPLTVDVPL